MSKKQSKSKSIVESAKPERVMKIREKVAPKPVAKAVPVKKDTPRASRSKDVAAKPSKSKDTVQVSKPKDLPRASKVKKA